MTAPARAPRPTPWRRLWPAASGVLVAAATAYALTDGRGAAPVVAASGLVYLAAAASGRRGAAWVSFAVAFVLIAIDKFTAFDAVPWLLVLAGAVLVAGLLLRRRGPWWMLPLQAGAMVAFGAIAAVALALDPRWGGLLVAAGLVAHAAWDIWHHRTDRVVDRSFAEFCAVLDVLVAIVVAVVSLVR